MKHAIRCLLLIQVLFILLLGSMLSPVWAEQADIEALGKEYLQLKERRRILPQGVFDRDLSGSGGRLEKVLGELGRRLGSSIFREEDVIRVMGKPDATKGAGETQLGSLGESFHEMVIPKGFVHLIYFWRGWHDYLYFVSRNGIILEAKWYFAGE